MNTKELLEEFDKTQAKQRLDYIQVLKENLNKVLPIPRIEVFQCKIPRNAFDTRKNTSLFTWKVVIVNVKGERKVLFGDAPNRLEEDKAVAIAFEWSENTSWPVINRDYAPEENEI